MASAAIVAALAIPASGFAQPAAAPSTSPPAAAAPTPHAAAPATSATTQAARHIGAGEMRASKMIGAAVYDQGDQKLGTIADLVVDQGGRVGDVVIGVDGKNVAVKMTDLKPGKGDHLVLNQSKDALSKMAAYDLNETAAKSGSTIRQ